MNSTRRVLLLAVIFWGCIWSGPAGISAGTDNRVQKLAIHELNRILEKPDSYYVLVVMAAWCAPCIKELPDLVAINKKFSDRGLNLIGLSIDYSGPEAMNPIIKQHRVNFPVYWVGEQAIEEYNIRRIPLMMMVKDGVVTERVVGMRSRKNLETCIVDFLNN